MGTCFVFSEKESSKVTSSSSIPGKPAFPKVIKKRHTKGMYC